MKTNKHQIQQGDVLAVIRPGLPPGCKRLDRKTVALGEHTGHHHSFLDDSAVALMEAPDGAIWGVNEGDKTEKLTHQEHNIVTLEPGQTCEFGQVDEYDWFLQMQRKVVD